MTYGIVQNKTLEIRLNGIIFESNTKAGKAFDAVLLILILASILIIMADSVPAYRWDKRSFYN